MFTKSGWKTAQPPLHSRVISRKKLFEGTPFPGALFHHQSLLARWFFKWLIVRSYTFGSTDDVDDEISVYLDLSVNDIRLAFFVWCKQNRDFCSMIFLLCSFALRIPTINVLASFYQTIPEMLLLNTRMLLTCWTQLWFTLSTSYRDNFHTLQ